MKIKKIIFIFFAILSFSLMAQEECNTTIPLNWCTPAPCKYRYTQTVVQPLVVERLPKLFALPSSCASSFNITKLPIVTPSDILTVSSGSSTSFITGVTPIRSIGNGAPVANISYTKWHIGIPPNCMYTSADDGSREIPEGWSLTTHSTNRPLPPSASCSSVRRVSICGGSSPRSGMFDVTPGNYVNCENGCTGPNSRYFTSGQSGIYFTEATAYDCNTVQQNRTCNNGTLSGNATFNSCLKRIDGVCGSSHASYSYTGAGSGACAAGTPSGVSGTWNWTCYGINGGNNANCTMYRNIDCSGSFGGWSACNASGVQYNTYTIYQYQAGQGAHCPYGNGYAQTNSCIPRRDCVGSWGACREHRTGGKNNYSVYLETFSISQYPSGGGSGCSYSNGATRSCSPPYDGSGG